MAAKAVSDHLKFILNLTDFRVRWNHVTYDQDVPRQIRYTVALFDRDFVAKLFEMLCELTSRDFNCKNNREINISWLS